MMELYIETLTGTAFELHVSPFETIMSVKAKIQELEGIPISQQHLVYQTFELDDDYCLYDYGIHSGATLKLVLAMRGGPINTRRVPIEDPTLREVEEYLESNRDEILERLPNNRHVTLLVFREGDQLNFFRVVDRGDGTLTPLSESISPASVYNLYEEDEEAPGSKDKTEENASIREKIAALRSKMDSMSVSKKQRQPDIVGGASTEWPRINNVPTFSGNSVDLLPSINRTVPLPPVSYRPNEFTKHNGGQQVFSPVPPREPKSAKSRLSQRHQLTKSFQIKDTNLAPELMSSSARHVRRSRELRKTPSETNIRSIPEDTAQDASMLSTEYARPGTSVKKPTDVMTRDRQQESTSEFIPGLRTTSRQPSMDTVRESRSSQRITLKCLSPIEARAMSGLLQQASLQRIGASTLDSRSPLRSRRIRDTNSFTGNHQQDGDAIQNVDKLPSVSTKKKTKSKRCSLCSKKTGLATSYQCRCGDNFCAVHRYAELHDCTFDYKTEGRKLLQQSNPVVSAPKLPKI